MGYLRRSLLALLVAVAAASAQNADTEVTSVENYKEWGWNALVMENGLITVATVPEIGARIMQYDLGEHASIFVNEDELGKLYEPASRAPWHNYGGYKNWPAPQSRWGWPPPPKIDFGLYEASVDASTADSVSVFVSGPVEEWTTPGLRFERRTTIFKGSSRVRVEQTLVNEGDAADSWSVWDVTQQIVNHPGERDFENFWVYFPINPESRYGESGVNTSASSSAWKGEVAPGIYGVQYLPEGKKIFADSPVGWVCYVDEQAGYAYAKTFDLYEGEYPDDGAHVEVWINGDPLLYMEVEVVSPIVELPANGGRYTFVEDWWTAKVNGPILEVNPVGAIAERLTYDQGRLAMTAGIFYEGEAQIAFVGGDGEDVGMGGTFPVTPLVTFILDEAVSMPGGATQAEVRVIDARGAVVGVLGVVELPVATAVSGEQAVLPDGFTLRQSYPNPFNASVAIEYAVPSGFAGPVELAVFNAAGEKVRILASGMHVDGSYRAVWNGLDERGREVASGVYFYRLAVGEALQVKRMALIR